MYTGFHYKNGWFFERLTDPTNFGSVKIYHVTKDHVDSEIIIDPHSWASIIASVSSQSETGYTYTLAKAFHGIYG